MNSSLTTPNFYIGNNDTVLHFYTYYKTERNYDYGYVEISTNNGSTWTQLTSFTDSSLTWIRYQTRLSYPVGTAVKLRFRFYSDASLLREGWFVDDININNGLEIHEELTLKPEITAEISSVLPNPFIRSVMITYALPNERHVKITVYDIAGKLVKTLVDQKVKAGKYNLVWDGVDGQGRRLPSGVYFTKIDLGKSKVVKKVILIR